MFLRDIQAKSGMVGNYGTAECVQVLLRTHSYTCHEETNKTLLQNFVIDVDKDQPNTSKSIFCLCCRHTATKATQYSECTARNILRTRVIAFLHNCEPTLYLVVYTCIYNWAALSVYMYLCIYPISVSVYQIPLISKCLYVNLF